MKNILQHINAKPLVNLTCLILAASMLIGCATQKNLGYGTVVKQQKIASTDYTPGRETVAGLGIGAGTGAATGAGVGAGYGALVGVAVGGALAASTGGIMLPAIPALALAGAASGAVYGAVGGAVVGGAVGTGAGYATGVYKQGDGLYKLSVKPDDQSGNLIITQYSAKPIDPSARVKIMMKDDHMYVEQA